MQRQKRHGIEKWRCKQGLEWRKVSNRTGNNREEEIIQYLTVSLLFGAIVMIHECC